MAARLGDVLYWIGCGIAVFFVLIFILVASNSGPDAPFYLGVYAVLAIVSWLIGRACRYILAGT